RGAAALAYLRLIPDRMTAVAGAERVSEGTGAVHPPLEGLDDQLIATLSVELKGPLTSLLGALEIAIGDPRGSLSHKQQQYIRLAREAGSRLNAVVDDLLDVAKSNHQRLPVRFTRVTLDDLCHRVIENHISITKIKNIQLSMHVEPEPTQVTADG